MNPLAPIAFVINFVYTALSGPIQWCLEHLTTAFDGAAPLRAIGGFGLSVIVVTLVIRGLLFPLFTWQIRTSRRTQAEQRLVAPHLKEIRAKYKKDPQEMNARTMRLYKEHNISPFSAFSGCLPLLVQLPIIGGLYNGIRHANVGHSSFLWVGDLSQSAKDGAGGQWADVLAHPWLLLIPVLAAGATIVQSKVMMQPARDDMSDQERMAYNTSRQMVFLIPVMILFMGLIFSQGLVLYWLTQSVMMIGQEWVILGWGGLRVPAWFPGAGRITPLSFSNPASTSLAALGSKAIVPTTNPARVSSGRGQKASRRVAAEAGSGRSTTHPARVATATAKPGGSRQGGQGRGGRRPAQSTAGGGRRKRGR